MLPNLINHPIAAGQFQDSGIAVSYNIQVPVVGQWMTPVLLGNVTPQQADTIMSQRAADYNSDQAENVFNSITYIPVGYVVDSTGLTAYFQYLPPGYVYNPMYWVSWPTLPAVVAPVLPTPFPNINELGNNN